MLSKVRAALGFDNVQFAITGSAPISIKTLEFFASLGIVIHEAYGMSETTGVCTMGTPGQSRIGKVGRPLRGVHVRVAEDGEVQLKGRTMTKGYLHLPEETAALYGDEGWLCTGDIGEIDAEGYLAITGRKKELLITAGGKNVAPVELEFYVQQIEGVDKVVVIGDRQPYLAALITIDVELLDELAQRFGGPPTLTALAENEAFVEHVEQGIERLCNARVARYQTLKKFKILSAEFGVEGGELTPTMKLRRTHVDDKYADEIAALYAGAANATP